MAADSSIPEQRSSEWFAYADSDIHLAQIHENDEEFIRHVCFLSQQTAEKYLKGFLAFSARNIPKIHELAALVKECGMDDANFDEWGTIVVTLADYAVSVRYPDGVIVTMADAIHALEVARDVREFVRQKIEEAKVGPDDVEMDDSR